MRSELIWYEKYALRIVRAYCACVCVCVGVSALVIRHAKCVFSSQHYRGADKSLARPTSRCILFDGQNISFDASLVIYINSTNIPPIMIINRIYETQNLLSL